MSIEKILWGILPAALAILSILASLYSLVRNISMAQALFSLAVVAGMGLSLWVLYRIFIVGAWPTYISHIAIGLLVPVAVGQLLVSHSRMPGPRPQLTGDAREGE